MLLLDIGTAQGPSQILQIVRWFNEVSVAGAAAEKLASVTAAAAAASGNEAGLEKTQEVLTLPLCKFKNKFASPRNDVDDGCFTAPTPPSPTAPSLPSLSAVVALQLLFRLPCLQAQARKAATRRVEAIDESI